MNTTVIIATRDQLLIKLKTPIITSGNDGTDSIQFKFDKPWKDLQSQNAVLKVAFFRSDDSIVKVQIVNDKCEIPKSMLNEPGILKFGLYAERNNVQVKTSNLSSYMILPGTKTSSSGSSDSIREADMAALSGALTAITGDDYSSLTWDELIGVIATLEVKQFGDILELIFNKLWEYYQEWYIEFNIDPPIDPFYPGEIIPDEE